MKILYLPNLTLYDANLTEGGGGGDDGSLKGIFIFIHIMLFLFLSCQGFRKYFVFLFFRSMQNFLFFQYIVKGGERSLSWEYSILSTQFYLINFNYLVLSLYFYLISLN